MPELPEVEVLARHLAPVLFGKRIRGVEVRHARTIRPGRVAAFNRALVGARFTGLDRRGKYLLFRLEAPHERALTPSLAPSTGVGRGLGTFILLGHLGMTGRMYLQPHHAALPAHAAVVMDLGRQRFVFEDTRYFGRLTLDTSALDRLGPEPLGRDFQSRAFLASLGRSQQAIKVRLLDQRLVAGVGNIYASEALFHARIAPKTPAGRLDCVQAARLRIAIRRVLRDAIRFGSTVPLDWDGRGAGKGLFYYGRSPDAAGDYLERLAVYDRAGQPCRRCGTAIARVAQAGRSTYYCPHCQLPDS